MLTLQENKIGRILITGGCGFIGRVLAESLVLANYKVTVIDNLSVQVHGDIPDLSWLDNNHIAFIRGDICDTNLMKKLLSCHEVVIHLASETGTAQSMYQIEHYSKVNISGTSILADQLLSPDTRVQRVILASSRAVYGEGKYLCPECGVVYPPSRTLNGQCDNAFELCCPFCNGKIHPVPTDENSFLFPSSIYGMSKIAQEHILRIACTASNIPYTILRLQNVYGVGQSLKNPYTGILPVFISQIKKHRKVFIFEDGLETRDFVNVKDVVSAIHLSLTNKNAENAIFNVGSGKAVSVLNIVRQLYQILQQANNYEITYKGRKGDIRHNIADISLIQKRLNFQPEVTFENGLAEFTEWAIHQEVPENYFEDTINTLKGKGLYSG